MTFSELVHLFSSHIVPADDSAPDQSVRGYQGGMSGGIPLLEKFVSQMNVDDMDHPVLKEESHEEEEAQMVWMSVEAS